MSQRVLFAMNISVGDGSELIKIHEGESIETVAIEFCESHNFNPTAKDLLTKKLISMFQEISKEDEEPQTINEKENIKIKSKTEKEAKDVVFQRLHDDYIKKNERRQLLEDQYFEELEREIQEGRDKIGKKQLNSEEEAKLIERLKQQTIQWEEKKKQRAQIEIDRQKPINIHQSSVNTTSIDLHQSYFEKQMLYGSGWLIIVIVKAA
ncbi:MAG: hypothetical protein EZS28_026382 [Streblomastix strix]|uniref:Uncharacterized protein n=1 Tax=Streblomastix strix TaxID=222440 RepID=A0A5J4V7B5_9EUKA|nr:MAG: hypothetical protein EZS28_026382 [Streblomastix strix]